MVIAQKIGLRKEKQNYIVNFAVSCGKNFLRFFAVSGFIEYY